MSLSKNFAIEAGQTISYEIPKGTWRIYPQSMGEVNIIVSLNEENTLPLNKESDNSYIVHFEAPQSLFFTNLGNQEINIFLNNYTAMPSALVATPSIGSAELTGSLENVQYTEIELPKGAIKLYGKSSNHLFAVSLTPDGAIPYYIGNSKDLFLDSPLTLYVRFVNPRFEGEKATLFYNNFTTSAGSGGGGVSKDVALLNAENVFTESQYIGSNGKGLTSDKQISLEVNATNQVSTIQAGSFDIDRTNKNFIALQSTRTDNAIQWKVGELTNQLVFTSDTTAQFASPLLVNKLEVSNPTTDNGATPKKWVEDNFVAKTAGLFGSPKSTAPMTDLKFALLYAKLFPNFDKTFFNLIYPSFISKQIVDKGFLMPNDFQLSLDGGATYTAQGLQSEYTGTNDNPYSTGVNVAEHYMFINENQNRVAIKFLPDAQTIGSADFSLHFCFAFTQAQNAWKPVVCFNGGAKVRFETTDRQNDIGLFSDDTTTNRAFNQSGIGRMQLNPLMQKNMITLSYNFATKKIKVFCNGALVGRETEAISNNALTQNNDNQLGLNLRKTFDTLQINNKVRYYQLTLQRCQSTLEDHKALCALNGINPVGTLATMDL